MLLRATRCVIIHVHQDHAMRMIVVWYNVPLNYGPGPLSRWGY